MINCLQVAQQRPHMSSLLRVFIWTVCFLVVRRRALLSVCNILYSNFVSLFVCVSLSACLLFCWCVGLSSHLCANLLAFLCVLYLVCVFVHMSTRLLACLPVCLPICLPLSLFLIWYLCVSICRIICLPASLFIYSLV